ncbi:MAG: CDP-diacylglycerol---glycerol-3-phosphate 3-phosphatidyltransferase [Thermomicrobiales bacterium]|nr:CDP-diacylglycerol---glycerol-3-phosphate 3-phosphatidyltransferase [Thermomicrobiales bacterium]
MISERIGTWIRGHVLFLGAAVARLGLSANMLTVIGLVLNAAVAAVIATGHPRWGGALLLLASAFDMLDGAVARATGTTSKFGGFLDSTLDRYSESVVFLGVLIFLLGTDDAKTGGILVFIATVGSLMISYARARAEGLGWRASVGLVARPERVILLAICLLIDRPLWALWALAVLTHLTAVTRILHVWRISQEDSAPGTAADRAVGTSRRP